MFRRVDIDGEPMCTGYSYINGDGYEETVSFGEGDAVAWLGNEDDSFPVYVDDIPNLIKALQATYNHKKGAA